MKQSHIIAYYGFLYHDRLWFSTFSSFYVGNVMVVMDSFALPVEGTETRVNAQEQAYEYMTAYVETANKVCTCIA